MMLETAVLKMMAVRTGAIEAPAGTGKTEQIARIACHVPGRWLVLTHTIAGRDAIRRRFVKLGIGNNKAHVDTIAAWSYRWACAYPSASGLETTKSGYTENWPAVYCAAAKLVTSGAVQSALTASYDGVLIDEYQDCSAVQHLIAQALKEVLRCYIFGDRLQAIFRFNQKDDDKIVEWDAALETFPIQGQLETPHRWNVVGNGGLGQWLLGIRNAFPNGSVDLRTASSLPVTWINCERDTPPKDLAKHCKAEKGSDDEILAVIDSSARVARRADLAKYIRGTTIEPVSGRCEKDFYQALETETGMGRVNALLDLAGTAWAGVDAAAKRKRVASILERPDRIKKSPTEMELALCGVARAQSLDAVLGALDLIGLEQGVQLARPELVSSVRSTLRLVSGTPSLALQDACWQAANQRRQKGRIIRDKSVGSTLLMKGLEFDHAIITPEACATGSDWYVALTRATRSIRVLSPSPIIDIKPQS